LVAQIGDFAQYNMGVGMITATYAGTLPVLGALLYAGLKKLGYSPISEISISR